MAEGCKIESPRPILDFVELTEIQKVELNNVKGNHVLLAKELTNFLKAFSRCTTEPNMQIKTGALSIIFTLKSGETYVARGTNKSEYLEISSEFATKNKNQISGNWLVLNTNGINFNNF